MGVIYTGNKLKYRNTCASIISNEFDIYVSVTIFLLKKTPIMNTNDLPRMTKYWKDEILSHSRFTEIHCIGIEHIL